MGYILLSPLAYRSYGVPATMFTGQWFIQGREGTSTEGCSTLTPQTG